jgi:hypothetical protein
MKCIILFFRHITVYLASKNSQWNFQLTTWIFSLHCQVPAIFVGNSSDTSCEKKKTTKAGTVSCGGQRSEEKRELPRGSITIVRILPIHHHQLPKTRSKCTAALAIPVCLAFVFATVLATASTYYPHVNTS